MVPRRSPSRSATPASQARAGATTAGGCFFGLNPSKLVWLKIRVPKSWKKNTRQFGHSHSCVGPIILNRNQIGWNRANIQKLRICVYQAPRIRGINLLYPSLSKKKSVIPCEKICVGWSFNSWSLRSVCLEDYRDCIGMIRLPPKKKSNSATMIGNKVKKVHGMQFQKVS